MDICRPWTLWIVRINSLICLLQVERWIHSNRKWGSWRRRSECSQHLMSDLLQDAVELGPLQGFQLIIRNTPKARCRREKVRRKRENACLRAPGSDRVADIPGIHWFRMWLECGWFFWVVFRDEAETDSQLFCSLKSDRVHICDLRVFRLLFSDACANEQKRCQPLF